MTPLPDATFTTQALLLFGLVMMVFNSWQMWANRRSSQKREVQFSFEPASKEEFAQHVAETRDNLNAVRLEIKTDRENFDISARTRSAAMYNKLDGLRVELSTKMDDIRREGKADTEGVHTRINDVLAAVSEIKGKVK